MHFTTTLRTVRNRPTRCTKAVQIWRDCGFSWIVFDALGACFMTRPVNNGVMKIEWRYRTFAL